MSRIDYASFQIDADVKAKGRGGGGESSSRGGGPLLDEEETSLEWPNGAVCASANGSFS